MKRIGWTLSLFSTVRSGNLLRNENREVYNRKENDTNMKVIEINEEDIPTELNRGTSIGEKVQKLNIKFS